MKVLASVTPRGRRGMNRFAIAVAFSACLVLLANPPRSLAQEFRATLTGTVTDSSGAVIPKAQVTAVNVDTGSAYTAKTSDAGVYYIPYVVPGTYTVKVTADGFKTAVQDKVLLLAGKYFGQNFSLEVGTTGEKIEVTAAPPMIETANGSGGTILDEKTLQNVPVNGRQVYMMIGTTRVASSRRQHSVLADFPGRVDGTTRTSTSSAAALILRDRTILETPAASTNSLSTAPTLHSRSVMAIRVRANGTLPQL